MSELKDRIKEAREFARLTPAELARRIGVTGSAVSQWEDGAVKNLRNEYLFALADVTGYSPRYIGTGEGTKLWVAEPRHGYNNTASTETITRYVPLVSWVQAGEWCGVHDPFPPGIADESVPVTGQVSAAAYALRVRGDSMIGADGIGFPDGATIIVDPTIEARHGSYVVVRMEDSAEATFKQLVIDGGKSYLRPLNSRYPVMEVVGNAVFCGVVKKMILEADFD